MNINNQGKIRPRAATLVGYHGYQNLGDDIFLRLICRWLGSSLNIKKCYLSTKGGMTERLISGVQVIPFKSPVSNISRLQWICTFRKAMQSDALIFSAGSIFTIQPFFLIYLVLSLLRFFRGKDLRIMAIGVSIGPFYSIRDQYWCLKGLSLMDYVLLRDYQSKLLVDCAKESINAQLSFDLALSWNEKQSTLKLAKRSAMIGLAITERALGTCKTNHTDNCIAVLKALEEMLANFNEVKVRILCVCSDQRDGDRRISHHFHEILTSRWGDRIEAVYYEAENIDKMLNSIAECSFLISARMHVGIMGILASVPVYQISYAEKIRNFFIHSEISTQYLHDHNKITQQSIYEFISRAMNGHLTNFTNNQKFILEEKGKRVSFDLETLAKEIAIVHPNAKTLP
jgi:polysaccharide pyruvyl transferase WcaK-like protein